MVLAAGAAAGLALGLAGVTATLYGFAELNVWCSFSAEVRI